MPCLMPVNTVHGDIRHLENRENMYGTAGNVHGDIRHLENTEQDLIDSYGVHGDIRHLEILITT